MIRDELIELWSMYHDIPRWLNVCRMLGVDDEGLSELETIDDIAIGLAALEKDHTREVNKKLRDFINETPKEWANERRSEYIKACINGISGALARLRSEYQDSFNHDEDYSNRAILTPEIERCEQRKRKLEMELAALACGDDKQEDFKRKVEQAKAREFSDFLELRKNKGLCPFHKDRTPSFSVRNGRGHCFGCGWHGDVLDFVQQSKGFSFREAVNYLAQ